MDQKTIQRYLLERKGDSEHAIVEGYHALKHVFRFGGEVSSLFIVDGMYDQIYGETVRDDSFEDYLQKEAVSVSQRDFNKLSPRGVRTGIIARVRKKIFSLEDVLSSRGRVVVLEDPRDLNNLGAVVRVCAARGDTALLVTGSSCLWHAHAIRGGAGLQWALPVAQTTIEEVMRVNENTVGSRPIYACTDEGDDMYKQKLASDSVFIFGTERNGITPLVRSQVKQKIAIPMQSGVSSMNLATSVSAVLFGVNR